MNPDRQKIMGFSIYKKGNSFYAVKKINKKPYWIRLGQTLEGAPGKIVRYCRERSIPIPNIEQLEGAEEVEKSLAQIPSGHVPQKSKVEKLEEELERYASLAVSLKEKEEELEVELEKCSAQLAKQDELLEQEQGKVKELQSLLKKALATIEANQQKIEELKSILPDAYANIQRIEEEKKPVKRRQKLEKAEEVKPELEQRQKKARKKILEPKREIEKLEAKAEEKKLLGLTLKRDNKGKMRARNRQVNIYLRDETCGDLASMELFIREWFATRGVTLPKDRTEAKMVVIDYCREHAQKKRRK